MNSLNSPQTSCIPLNQPPNRDYFKTIQNTRVNPFWFNSPSTYNEGTVINTFSVAQLGQLKLDATNNKLIPQREVQISKPEAENTHRSFETYTNNALKDSFGLDDNEISRIVNHLKASARLQPKRTRAEAAGQLNITYCSHSKQYLFYCTYLNKSLLLALTDEDQVWIQKIVSTLRAKKILCAHVKIVLNIHWKPQEVRLRWHDDQFKGFPNIAALHTCVVKSPDLHSSTSNTSQESHTVELGLINKDTNTKTNSDVHANMFKPAGGVATIKDDAIEKLALIDGTVIFDKDNGFQNPDRLEKNDPIIYQVVSISEQKHTGYFIDQCKLFVAADGNITKSFKMVHSAGPLRCTPPKELPKKNEDLHRFLDDPGFTCREVVVIRTSPTTLAINLTE